MSDDSDLDRRWKAVLVPLREDSLLPPGLEGRIGRNLRAGRGGRWLPLALAAMLLLAVGGLLGRWSAQPPRPQPDQPRFMLLLFEGPAYDSVSATHDARVAEYREWAGALASRGQLVDAAELGPAEQRLGNLPDLSASGGHVIGGFFILRARDQAEALRIAATCPHLKHGGGVSVRPLTTS
jgi:hypothetical protein